MKPECGKKTQLQTQSPATVMKLIRTTWWHRHHLKEMQFAHGSVGYVGKVQPETIRGPRYERRKLQISYPT